MIEENPYLKKTALDEVKVSQAPFLNKLSLTHPFLTFFEQDDSISQSTFRLKTQKFLFTFDSTKIIKSRLI